MTGIWKARLGLWTWRPRLLCLQYNLGGTYSLVDPMVQRCSSAREGYIGIFWGAKKNKSAERLESSFVVTKVPPVWMYYWKCLVHWLAGPYPLNTIFLSPFFSLGENKSMQVYVLAQDFPIRR